MHPSTRFLAGFLAIIPSVNANTKIINYVAPAGIANKCGGSTLYNGLVAVPVHVGPAQNPPSVQDCKFLGAQERSSARIYQVSGWDKNKNGGYLKTHRYHGCHFMMRASLSSEGIVEIGMDDIGDVIRDSIAKFATPSGRVAAGGQMKCGDVSIDWLVWGTS